MLRQKLASCVDSVESGFALFPFLPGGLHPRFRCDTQGIGNAIDVVEVADNLGSQRDLFVRIPDVSQCHDIIFSHITGRQCEFHGEITKSSLSRSQFGQSVVERDLLGRFSVVGLLTEVPGMRQRSVVAVVDITDDRRQQFAGRTIE